MSTNLKNELTDSESRIIRKLSAFGQDFKHHHENYEDVQIAEAKASGGTWKVGEFEFFFPKHFGFCYGVDRAIDLAFETCERFPNKRIFLTDQLIHNPFINEKLKERGVQCLDRDNKHFLITDALNKEDVVFVSAFGTDFRDIERLQKIGCTIVDSTCGAIINVWKRIADYAKDQCVTVVHGKRNHEETRATSSRALKDGTSYIVIENKAEAHHLADVVRGKVSEATFTELFGKAVSYNFVFDPDHWKMGMANQTTMMKEESLAIQDILRQAFEDRFGDAGAKEKFRSFDTICSATQDRQDALRQLLDQKLDILMIVGGFNSSNTAHLAEIASQTSPRPRGGEGRERGQKLPYYHIQSEEDLLSETEIRARDPHTGEIATHQNWFPKGARRIGITSGASTPDVILLKLIQKIAKLHGTQNANVIS